MTYQASAIQKQLIDTVMALFGDNATTKVQSGGESISVTYGGYTLPVNADSVSKAADAENLMVNFMFGNHKGLKLISLKTAKTVFDIVIGNEIDPDQQWYVVRETGGKFADGYYGFDGNIHDDEQIFSGNSLPYKPNSDGIENILVGTGKKPNIYDAQKHIDEWLGKRYMENKSK
jgi:hypothetical protein